MEIRRSTLGKWPTLLMVCYVMYCYVQVSCMFVHVYLCVCVPVVSFIFVRTYLRVCDSGSKYQSIYRTYVYMNLRLCTCDYVYFRTCIYVSVYLCTCNFVHVGTVYVSVYICTYVSMCLFIYVCVFVCLCNCMFL